MAKKIERNNMVFISIYNEQYKIINYYNRRKVEIEFANGYRKLCRWEQIIKGHVVNPYTKTVCNIGFLGEGQYNKTINRKQTQHYIVWHGMMQRCYDKEFHKTNQSYVDCLVCEEWHNFQNFAKWFDDNYYEVNNEIMCLDKDILYKGNKIYSPETCIFVPRRINQLFVKGAKERRNNLPIGVKFHKGMNKLIVSCSIFENNQKILKHLGYFDINQEEQAFYCYKNFKETYIKKVANQYKNSIPDELYQAMCEYEVSIND